MAKKNQTKRPDYGVGSAWSVKSTKQEHELMEDVTEENCGAKLRFVRSLMGSVTRKHLAEVLGVSVSTVTRLEEGTTYPSSDFMYRLAALVVIGKDSFLRLSEKERRGLAEVISGTSGVGAGIGVSIRAVCAAGGETGLSAAGIASGCTAVGATAGFVAGAGSSLGFVASVPVVAGAMGYGLLKGIRAICKANALKGNEVDGRYELIPDEEAAAEKKKAATKKKRTAAQGKKAATKKRSTKGEK